MAIIPADMEECTIKQRCLSGENKGTAYDPAAPCANGNFNPVTCDCEVAECGAVCSLTVRWKVSYDTYELGCVPRVKECFEFGDTPYSTVLTGHVNGTTWEFIAVTDEEGEIGGCNGERPQNPAIRYTKCVNGVPTLTTVSLGAPGCSVNTSAGRLVNSIYATEQTSSSNCTVTVQVSSERWQNTYDCLDCSGTLVGQVIDGQNTNIVTMSLADYETAYVDCSNLDNPCETSCIVKTLGGKSWHLEGWDIINNCEPAGQPDSGQNFICPSNVSLPCNAYDNPFLQYYSNSGRLYFTPRTTEPV